jgi:hypothetical protein
LLQRKLAAWQLLECAPEPDSTPDPAGTGDCLLTEAAGDKQEGAEHCEAPPPKRRWLQAFRHQQQQAAPAAVASEPRAAQAAAAGAGEAAAAAGAAAGAGEMPEKDEAGDDMDVEYNVQYAEVRAPPAAARAADDAAWRRLLSW